MLGSVAAEEICARAGFAVRRVGRFIVAEFLEPHRVLSTSALTGGQTESVRYAVNHQSCEGGGHFDRHELITSLGADGYHEHICEELGLDPRETALMGTAANMNYAAHRAAQYDELTVDAIVTAGVDGNAARAGDPAQWAEGPDGTYARAHNPHAGTINTMLFVSCPLTPAAQTRAAVTMTEAKSAALAELAVPSRYSANLATGTGTDQFCLAAPLDPARRPREAAGPHVKLGEIIARAVLEATKEALRWQNGLESSYTRSLFHVLGRFGLTREAALERLQVLLTRNELTLLEKNEKAVFFEPRAAAAAYAFAAVLDRVRYGTLPAGLAGSALRQQAAGLAAALSARPQDWAAYWNELPPRGDDPVDLVTRAIALGWKHKWT